MDNRETVKLCSPLTVKENANVISENHSSSLNGLEAQTLNHTERLRKSEVSIDKSENKKFKVKRSVTRNKNN